MTQPINTVNWTGADAQFTTGWGGNGMFCYAVVIGEGADTEHACTVDVQVQMTAPGAGPGEQSLLWEPEHQTLGYWTQARDVSQFLRDHGAPARLVAWPLDAWHGVLYSRPVLASVFLGSTDLTLYDEQRERPFAVEPRHLDPVGLALYSALAFAYNLPVTLLTFLDT